MALRDTAIIGHAEVPNVARSDRDIWEIGGDILGQLLDRTGLEKSDVDGLFLSSSGTGASSLFWAQITAENLGLELDVLQTVDVGGCSPVGCVARAAAAIDAGLCTTAFLLFADTPVNESNIRFRNNMAEFTAPQGMIGPPADFGLLSSRYAHQFGLDEKALAKLAVAQRSHAVLNENALAKLRTAISEDDYLNSRMIADPIKLLDCVMICDGGSGLLITSRARAVALKLDRFVVPIGYGERSNHDLTKNLPDITQSGHQIAGQRAFSQAGLTPDAIASFHPYDDFLIAIMLQLENLGFCGAGQGAAFIHERDWTFKGDFPLNTGGGQISAGQAGLAGGGTNLVEAVRQLFGDGGTRQVRDIRNALVTGIGYIPYARNWTSSAALILVPDA